MMKEMRVLFCKIQSPLICFCKPSAAHIYTSGPVKLEKATHPQDVHSTDFDVSDSSDNSSSESEDVDVNVNVKKEAEIVPKSCIRKKLSTCEVVKKKQVKWIDYLGKELAEVKEFESSETGNTNNEDESSSSSSRCLCVIL